MKFHGVILSILPAQIRTMLLSGALPWDAVSRGHGPVVIGVKLHCAARRVRQPCRIRGWYGMAIRASVPEDASCYFVLDYKQFLHCVASHRS